MNKYKVTKKDLIGEIAGFPIEVVQKMLEYQVKQGNKEDVKVFQSDSCAGQLTKGFSWFNTIEEAAFWYNVISLKQFDVFFAKYPKNGYVYIYQDDTKKGKDIINTLIKYGGVDSLKLAGESKDTIYYNRLGDNTIAAVSPQSPEGLLVKTFYTEIQPESSVKEYTMQEIADKLGINVNELRIKK